MYSKIIITICDIEPTIEDFEVLGDWIEERFGTDDFMVTQSVIKEEGDR